MSRRRRFLRARRGCISGHELARILRRELALLFEEAALLRARLAPFGLFLPESAPPGSLAAWRREARAALERFAGDAAALLAVLAARPRRRWPRASLLAARALALDPCAQRSLVQAEILLAEGDTRAARALFVELCTREPCNDLAWRAYAGLAAAHEREGNDLLASAALERAARIPGCGPAPLVDGLFLALALPNLPRARRAGRVLDDLIAPDAACLQGELARLGQRIHLLRGGARLTGPAAGAARRLARAGGAPSARVARLALGGGA